MKSKNYSYIILFISLTIVATISLQLYWNLKNYRENKARLINEVQIALDNSIENYYVEDAKNDFIAFVNDNKSVKMDDFIETVKMDTLFKNRIQKIKKEKPKHIVVKKDSSKRATIIECKINSITKNSFSSEKDNLNSIKKQINSISITNPKKTIHSSQKNVFDNINHNDLATLSVFKGKKLVDSISNIKDLANRIVISMVQDSINFKKLNAHLKKELKRKNITVFYAFHHYKLNTLFDKYNPFNKAKLPLKTLSKSTYLPQGQKLELTFSNPMFLVLKRSITEIVLSLLLSLSIILCLLYLLRTINKQKKIDEIKNDLISNITHEFKTPITTIATAIEGIKSFNSKNDIEKTNRYLDISKNQLTKLEVMVERLLETASLETDQLTLKKEKTDLLALLNNCIEKHQLNCIEKNIFLQSDLTELFVNIDSFHIENVMSNLLDNAIKYGGNDIEISLISDKKTSAILIKDNGIGIDKSLKEKIFEKFYRIPKGNIHDVKGFGIGLYYSKKIIEKQGATIELASNSNPTLFKITFFNEN